MCDCQTCQRLHVDQVGPQGAEIARLAWFALDVLEIRNGARPTPPEGLTSLLKLLAASPSGPNDPMDFWVGTLAAASLLGVTPRQARRLARTGRLGGAQTHGRDWIIPRSSIEAYRRSRRARVVA